MTVGYYQMHRGWMDNPIFPSPSRDPLCKRAAWVWLIEHAAFDGAKRGTLSFSVRYLAQVWGWPPTKVFEFLRACERAEMIRTAPSVRPDKSVCLTRTATKTITVCNYDKYQLAAPFGSNSSRTVSEHNPNTARTNNNKKERRSSPPICLPVGETSSPPVNGEGIDSDFEIWWKAVPRKQGRGRAIRAYRTARKKASAETLLAGIQRYARSRDGEDAKFTCLPATWLNDERWLDDASGNGSATEWQWPKPTEPPPRLERG